MSYFKPQQRTSSNSNSSNKASNVNWNRYKSKVNSRNSSEVHKKVYKNSSCLNWKSKETPKDIGTFELMRESLSNFLCDQDEKQEDDKLPQRGVPVWPKFNAKFQDFAKNKWAAYDYPIKASKDRMKNLSSKVDEQTNLWTCTAEDKAELDSLNASDTFRSLTYDLLEHSTNNLPNNFSSPKPVNWNQNFHIKMPKEAWGRYWVFVSSETQKSIIRNWFQIIDLSQRDWGIRYAISSDWWREWWDYVNIEFYDPSDQSNSNAGMMVKEVSSILIEEDSFNWSDSSSANKKSNGNLFSFKFSRFSSNFKFLRITTIKFSDVFKSNEKRYLQTSSKNCEQGHMSLQPWLWRYGAKVRNAENLQLRWNQQLRLEISEVLVRLRFWSHHRPFRNCISLWIIKSFNLDLRVCLFK